MRFHKSGNSQLGLLIVFYEYDLIVHVIQGLSLSTASLVSLGRISSFIYPLGVMHVYTDVAWCILQCWNGKGIGNIGPIIDKLISLWPSK